MSKTKKGLFTSEDGRNHTFIFFLIALLFTLWAAGNSLIDAMNKHFQDYFHLTKSQFSQCSVLTLPGIFFYGAACRVVYS